MSKIGEKAITIPSSVQVDIAEHSVNVKGAQGEISIEYPKKIKLERSEDTLKVLRKGDDKNSRSLHGLFRSLISNAVAGVEKPWEKRLEVVGTGFNVKQQGEELVFKIGYSHSITFPKVAGVSYKVEGNNKVIVAGANKQLVGQVAYQIKSLRKPDAYKGKGLRYEGERIKLKPGKKAKTTA